MSYNYRYKLEKHIKLLLQLILATELHFVSQTYDMNTENAISRYCCENNIFVEDEDIIITPKMFGTHNNGTCTVIDDETPSTSISLFFKLIDEEDHEVLTLADQYNSVFNKHKNPHKNNFLTKYQEAVKFLSNEKICILLDRFAAKNNGKTQYIEVYPLLSGNTLFEKMKMLWNNEGKGDTISDYMNQVGKIIRFMEDKDCPHKDCFLANFFLDDDEGIVAFDFGPTTKEAANPNALDDMKQCLEDLKEGMIARVSNSKIIEANIQKALSALSRGYDPKA